jgi:signal peptide peptidase SppA
MNLAMNLTHRLLTDAPMIADFALSAFLNRIHGEPMSAEHPALKAMRERLKPQMTISAEGIATIPVEGILARKPDVYEMLYGVEDTSAILDMVETAQNSPDVRGILVLGDSPGGFVTGGPEVADAIKQTNKQKPVVAWTGGTMASLAYYICSQAGTVVASRSSQVGSIGVMAAYADYTKAREQSGVKLEVIRNKEADFKSPGAYGTALNDDQRAHIQERIQASFKDFKKAVQTARPQVKDDAMRGQVFTGSEAKREGLVDAVGDKSYALALLRREIRKRS